MKKFLIMMYSLEENNMSVIKVCDTHEEAKSLMLKEAEKIAKEIFDNYNDELDEDMEMDDFIDTNDDEKYVIVEYDEEESYLFQIAEIEV